MLHFARRPAYHTCPPHIFTTPSSIPDHQHRLSTYSWSSSACAAAALFFLPQPPHPPVPPPPVSWEKGPLGFMTLSLSVHQAAELTSLLACYLMPKRIHAN